jgi:type III secretion protein L
MANIIRSAGGPPPGVSGAGTRVPTSPPKGGQRIESEVFDARSQAARIIAEAERDAAELRARAQQDFQRAMEDGRRQGYESGINEAAQLLAEARALREKLIRETEPQLIKLALKVAVKIIGHELEHNKDEIAQIVGNALDTVRQQRDIIVRVHPDDLKNLEAAKPQLIARLGRAKDIDLRGDRNIKRGGCIIDTEIGTIDAQLDTQLEQITSILLGGRAGR